MPENEIEQCVNDGRLTGNPVEPRKKDIQIIPALNGFIVHIGCQRVVFETKEKMLSELSRYLDNREAVEKEYLEKYK